MSDDTKNSSQKANDPQLPKDKSQKAKIAEMEKQLKEQAKITEELKGVPDLLNNLLTQIGQLREGSIPEQNESHDRGQDEDNPDSLGFSDLIGTDNVQGSSENDYSAEALEILESEHKDESVGPSIAEAVAKRFERIATSLSSKEVIEKVKENLKVPENCKSIAVPKLNPELWTLIPQASKSTDAKIQMSQQSISKGLVSLALIADQITKHSKTLPREFCETTLSLCLNGANMLAIGQRDMNHRRKQLIRPHLGTQYTGICNFSAESGQFLFGDDLSEKIKSTKSLSSIMKPANSNTRYSPYTKPRGNLNYRGPPRFPIQTFRGSQRGRPFPSYNNRPQQRFQKNFQSHQQ